MLFSQIITPETVTIDYKSESKTAVLRQLSQLFSRNIPDTEQQALFEAYWEREQLGSTAIGNGIVVPHIHLPALKEPRGCFIKLIHPVDFGAKDKQPIDLVVGVLSPQHQNQQHLIILSNIVKEFSCPDFCKACRNKTDAASLYALITKAPIPLACL